MPDPAGTYLTLHQKDGSEVTVTITGAGAGLRVAVGSLHHRSSIWRATANADDIYLTAKGLGQMQKMSFHASGVWRHAFHSERHAAEAGAVGKAEFNNDPRVIDRWEEPEGTNGWMHALTVWVPHGHLSELPNEVENPRKPIQFVPAPCSGEMVGIHFAIVRPDEGFFGLAGMTLVDGFALPSGRALVVLSSRRSMEPTREEWLTKMSVAALALTQPGEIRTRTDPLRIGLFTTADDGHRAIFDLCAPNRQVLEHLQQTGFTVDKTFRPPAQQED